MMTSTDFTRRHVLAATMAAFCTLHLGVHAETYPARPIRLVVLFPPGARPTCWHGPSPPV